MPTAARNSIEFRVKGRYALFTDPLTKIGGEKCSYHVPTYESLKGIVKSIYWKPTIVWVIDRVRVMKRIQTQTKGMKPLKYASPGNELSIYTYLVDVEYQVQARFIWNEHRPELKADRVEHKHHNIAKRMVERGGRQDIFLGTRECQGYIEPCEFGSGSSAFDDTSEVAFGLMFHGFDYPDEIGGNELRKRLWRPTMKNGVITFEPPERCIVESVRRMSVKKFELSANQSEVAGDESEWVT
jgi:CRISPR-associated protein Cas5d